MTPLSFRPLQLGDFPLVHAFMNAPHAERWWGREFDEFEEEYRAYVEGRVPIHPYVVLYDHEPIGMVQWERFGDDPAFMATYAVDEPEAVNCDVLIGAPGFAHRGLGPELIRQFLTTLAMADERAPYCVIDPEVENAIAIRAYAKLGFTHVRTCDDGWGAQVYLMQASREVIFGLEALDWRAAAGSRAP